MAQVGKINQFDIGSLVSSAEKTSSVKNSAFSDIMSSNMKNYKNNAQKNTFDESVQTTKAKLESGSSSAKKLEHSDTQGVKQELANEGRQVGEAGQENTMPVNNVEEEQPGNICKEKLAQILGITEEELEKIMAESGFTVMDLLNPEVLQQLVLEVNGSSEVTDLLMNETMCNQLKEMLEVVEEFAQTVDMEQFEAVAAVEEDFSEVLSEVSDRDSQGSIADSKEEKQEQVITVQKEVSSTDDKTDQRKGSSSKDGDNESSTLNQFVQNLSDSVIGTGEITAESVEKMQQMQEIVNQVVEKIKVTLSSDSTSMEMQLNPENLGKVHVSVISKNGEMTAAFTVESQIAKEALESQITTLKDNLQEQGIKVDAIEVTVAEHGLSQDEFSRQNQQQFQNQKKQNSNSSRIRLRGEDSIEEEAEEVIQSVNSNGTVDFSA